MTPRRIILIGMALLIGIAALWHGPVGQAGARYAAQQDAAARATLDRLEMDRVVAFAQRDPLARRLWLAGDANDFQREELVRRLSYQESISDVRWWRPGSPRVEAELLLPLIIEVELAALSGFGFGIIFTYLIALRRRARRDHII